MTKNKRNQGIAILNQMDSMDEITKGANLKEIRIDKNKEISQTKIKHGKLIQIPDKMMVKLNEAKDNCRIHTSIHAFIIDSIREKMIKEGLLKFD